ncbi:MAG: UbiX family flavin prenyltransferase [Deltaproteobacteria bacterium]|nr:MAG: UbiX family flavin prenyltransferase [Deltaproteobacteria bacterium]
MKHVLVAMTGASGSIYGLRLIEALLRAECRVSLLLSEPGRQVLNHECGLNWSADRVAREQQVCAHFRAERIAVLDNADLFAAVASGSNPADAMVICPCSMGTAGRVAAGLSETLLERAADVMLKERRPLLLVPRETPLSVIHLDNLLRLARAGAVVIPAMPAFYHGPRSLDDLVDFVVGKILDQLGVGHELFKRWGGEDRAER